MSDYDPQPTLEPDNAPSVEKALAGNFHWTIDGVIKEAWQLQKGAKMHFWGALIISYAFIFAISLVSDLAFTLFLPATAANSVAQLVVAFTTWPLFAGLTMMAVKRTVDLPINTTMVFDYYVKILPIFLLYLLTTVLVSIGFVLLILPGIYLTVAYSLALPLMLDKNMGIWEALETSRKALTQCWFRMFGLLLLMGLLMTVSIIPLGVGLIWTLPMMMLAIGLVYRNMFNVEEPSEQLF